MLPSDSVGSFVMRPEVSVEVLGRLLHDVDMRARSLSLAAPALSRKAAPEAAAQQDALADVADRTAVQEGATETVFTLPHRIDLAAGHGASVSILRL